ncbi:MAG: flagellar type III secretion system pore protein FliP [Planctomycetota bacterium]|jgi:flagellar biosynthetic protein FliP
MHRNAKKIGFLALLFLLGMSAGSFAQETGGTDAPPTPNAMPEVGDLLSLADKATSPGAGTEGRGDWAAPVKLAVVFTVLALLPSLLVMMTSFTRIVIVLSFIRRALTTQAIPPNIALIGLALFLTIFTMSPTLAKINEQAIGPYLQDEITFAAGVEKCNELLKDFMLRQTRKADLDLFSKLAGIETPSIAAEVPTHVAIPAFAISEFYTAFYMGFLLFVPFLLVDLVIAGILLSAGMMMLPPVIISLPFKIILFIVVDGWQLLAESLVKSFN